MRNRPMMNTRFYSPPSVDIGVALLVRVKEQIGDSPIY
jgi:hypothetical protein